MGKTKKRFKIWHGVLTLVLVFGMGVGFTMSSRVSAIGDTGREAREVEHQNPPAAAVGRNNRVRPVEGGSEDFSRGIDLGPNRASETPGTSSQPVPRFSGLNAPWWLNSNGPVEVPDDSIFHGLVDVRAGLINNDPNKIVLPGAPAPGPGPALAPAPAPGAGGPQLNIALALGTPVGSTVAQGSSPEVTKINFTASGGDITVTRIAITRGGLATESDIFTICLLEGTNALVLPDCAVINAGEAGMPTYTVSSLNWQIPNGQTKQLTVQANVRNNATAGRTFSLGISAATDVTVAAGTVTGSATGNTFTVAAPAPAPPSVAITLAPTTPIAANVTPGKTDHNATLVRFTAAAGSSASISAITVTRSGTALDSALQNVKIFDNTTNDQLGSTVSSLTSGSATFNLTNPWTIAAGQFRDLRIVTDVTPAAALGGRFQLGISAVSSSNATPTGLPVNGNLFTITAAPQPDLRISSLTMNDATPDLGQVITLSGTVYNGGTADAPDSRGRFCFDNANCLINETGLIYQHGVGPLPLTNPTSPPLNTTWTATGGTHTIYYCVDVTPVVAGFAPVAELNEINNCIATPQFTVIAPTLTLARSSPIPAAGETLTPGNDRVLLEADASMNTGTVRLSRLYVLPIITGNASSVISSSLKLQRKRADGTWVNIASNPTTPIVNGRNVYHFAIGNNNADSDVGTTIVKLRVIANISCIASAASIDLIVDKTTDVEVTTLPAGFTVSGVPFAQVPRNMTLCPTATLSRNPAIITLGQSATLTWTTTNATSASINQNIGAVTPVASGTRQVTPANNTTYTLTATNASGQTATAQATVTVTVQTPLFGGGYVNSILGLDSVLNSDFFESSNDVSPLDYFFPTAHAAPLIENLDLPIIAELLQKGQKGTVLFPANQLSALRTLVEEHAIDNAQEKELNALIIPENILLTLPEKTAIARLIPGARKTGAPKAGPAGVTVRGITLYNPVTIHDDLWVRGSGNPLHEPGNLVVNGRIVAYDGTLNVEGSILATGEIRSASGVNLGDVGAETQINGDFSVVGGTTTLGFTKITGPLTALNGGTISGQFNVLGPSSFGEVLLGTTTVNGPLTASNGGTISGQFNVLGPSSFGEVLLGTTTVNGPFTAGGVATFNGNTTLANVTISGTLTTNGNATFGAAATVGGALTASGTFTANGNTALAATTISGLLTANNSTIMNKDLTVYENAVFKKDIGVGGNLSAAAIGAFYRLEKSITTPNKAGPSSAEVSCGAGDILVSCSGSFSGEQFRGTTMTEAAGKIQKCKADGNQTSAAPKNLKVQAVCFDPNRNNSAPAGAVGL